MELKKYNFEFNIHGRKRNLPIEILFDHGNVITNTKKYCPDFLLQGRAINPIGDPLNGESEIEFIKDCKNFIKKMENIEAIYGRGVVNLRDMHYEGLKLVVDEHISKFNRLILADLLIYIDIYSLLLEANGFPIPEIRALYPQVTKEIVDLYPKFILNTRGLNNFKESLNYQKLKELVNNNKPSNYFNKFNSHSLQLIENIYNSACSIPLYRDYWKKAYTYDETYGVKAIELGKGDRSITLFLFYPGENGKIDSIAIYGDCLEGHLSAIQSSMKVFDLPVKSVHLDRSGLTDFVDVYLI